MFHAYWERPVYWYIKAYFINKIQTTWTTVKNNIMQLNSMLLYTWTALVSME